jgi:putative molybdopterin biosynthesis protein
MPRRPKNRVRSQRDARGLSQLALAERVSLTRQSVGAIEAGRATPSVEVALRIATALDCTVEDLFGAVSRPSTVGTDICGAEVAGRVALAHLGGRWVSYPLDQDGLQVSADAVVARAAKERAQVELVRSLAEARDNVILMGCAPALGLLADRLNSRPGPGRFVWFARSSTGALEAVDRAQTHVAGVHLTDAQTGEANLADVRRIVSSTAVVVVTLARWEVGLVGRAGDGQRARNVADLGRRGIRLVARESGAGAQRLLDQVTRTADHLAAVVRSPHLRVGGHLEVARAVSLGAADVGVATRDAAIAFGLEFSPLAEERYDLVLPGGAVDDPRILRLLDVLVSSAFRRELSTLGYDVRPAGERVAVLGAA